MTEKHPCPCPRCDAARWKREPWDGKIGQREMDIVGPYIWRFNVRCIGVGVAAIGIAVWVNTWDRMPDEAVRAAAIGAGILCAIGFWIFSAATKNRA